MTAALGLTPMLAGCNTGEQTGQASEASPGTLDLSVVFSSASVGLDTAKLEDLAQCAAAGYWGKLDSLHVVRHGKLVLERYFRDYIGESLHHMYSVTKSVTSLLIGIALAQGHIESLDQKLLSFFPEYEKESIANLDAGKARITLADVLTMRAGFRWDEWSTPYTHPLKDTTALFNSVDWMKHMLDLPMATEPGSRFVYNSGATMLLSGILRNTTGMTALAFAESNLFGPLGIEDFKWNEGPDGIANTGWGLFLKPRDMLKIGQLVLNGGVWEGRRLLPEAWIKQSTMPHVLQSVNTGYGFQWWTMPLPGQNGHAPQLGDVPYASGWGGQFIFVVPDLDLVVVMTAENYDGAPRSARSMLVDFVFPAVQDGKPSQAY